LNCAERNFQLLPAIKKSMSTLAILRPRPHERLKTCIFINIGLF
jgi:hypothetical protein